MGTSSWRPSRWRRSTRIFGLGVAVISVFLLVVFAALVTRVGSGQGKEAAVSQPVAGIAEPTLVTINPSIAPVPTDAPMPVPEVLSARLSVLAANPALGAFTGQVADAKTGTVLWELGAQLPRTPASTAKILTAAAALLSLPSDHRVTTRVLQGAASGEVVLVGTGDPTMTAQPAGQPSFYANAARLDDLVGQLRSNSTPVTRVLVDTSAYVGNTMAAGWNDADIAGGYIAPCEPVMLDGGRVQPLSDESPRSASPALDAGRELARRLGTDVTQVQLGSAASNAKELAVVHSAPLLERLQQLMTVSDNVLAESVGREIAAATGQEPSFAGAVRAVTLALSSAGFRLDGVDLQDVSGLSLADLLPARVLSDVLATAAADTKVGVKLRPLLDMLPVAGATGTLSSRYLNGDRNGAGWVRAKTGTLSTASSLAGVVVDMSNRVLTFSFISNGVPPNGSRPALDELAGTLRLCGCI
ncbi:MAG: D-alanyl-D-alanine carboxypeptidase/D-alanyl-D-alanine endopeptidase [Mycobacteriaceae bacterium]